MQRAILHDSGPYCVCTYVHVQIHRILTHLQIWCHLSIMRLPHSVWPSNTWILRYCCERALHFQGIVHKSDFSTGWRRLRGYPKAKEPLIVGLFLQKMTGRAAARRTAPTLPLAVRVGPNEGGQQLGVYPGVYPLHSRIVVYTIKLSDMGWLRSVGSLKF